MNVPRPLSLGRLLILFGALSLSSLAAQAEDRIRYDIPAQSLESALTQFGVQSKRQLVFDPEVIPALTTGGVRGEYAPMQALDLLLSNSGLTYAVDGKDTIIVRRPSPTASVEGRFTLTQADAAAAAQQDTAKDPSATPGAVQKELEALEEIVVTGTHIRGAPPSTSSLTVYDREDIERSGAGSVSQFMRKIPQNFTSVDADTLRNTGNSGTSEAGQNMSLGTAVNLRGLGAGSTLVLLNGHRLAPAGARGSFTDVSMIPLSAVERVEVLSDGASAIYGADAVAGVVNFVLRKNFEGAETSLRYGDTSDGGAREVTASQLLGGDWQGGNAMLTYEYFDQDGLLATQRDFIPPQGGRTLILPNQRRHSAFLAAQQELGANLTLFGEAYYSTRDFLSETSDGFSRSHNVGESRQHGEVLGARRGFANGWQGQLVASHAQTKEEPITTLFNPFFPSGSITFSVPSQSQSTGFDLQADGPVFALPGGMARASIGTAARREEFDLPLFVDADSRRDVKSLFGELLLPFVGEGNSKSLVNRFELSLAVRHDDYDDFGSSTDPKVGALWSPVVGLSFRGTYATSFRAPPLIDGSDGGRIYTYDELTDPTAGDLNTNTLFLDAIGNPAIQPEESRSFTFGIDLRPQSVPTLSVSATYYDIDYTDRIAFPPLVGFPSDLFFQADTLAPFIDSAPDPAEIQAIFTANPIFDARIFPPDPYVPPQPGDVEAVFDNRIQNIASTRTSGIDFAVDYTRAIERGELGFFLSSTYLLKREDQVASTTPTVDLVNKIYNPMDWRVRGGMSWTLDPFSISFSVDHRDGYENNLVTPVSRVDSWTTADLQLAYRTGEQHASAFLQDLAVILDIQNLTDEAPPFIESSFATNIVGYDATNASPRGRFISMSVAKRWGRR